MYVITFARPPFPLFCCTDMLVHLSVCLQEAERKVARQLVGQVLPISQTLPSIKARAITDEERNTSVFRSMRVARANARLIGIREKRAREAAEQDLLKKK